MTEEYLRSVNNDLVELISMYMETKHSYFEDDYDDDISTPKCWEEEEMKEIEDYVCEQNEELFISILKRIGSMSSYKRRKFFGRNFDITTELINNFNDAIIDVDWSHSTLKNVTRFIDTWNASVPGRRRRK